jgi:hypothetical protein
MTAWQRWLFLGLLRHLRLLPAVSFSPLCSRRSVEVLLLAVTGTEGEVGEFVFSLQSTGLECYNQAA